MTTSSKIGVIFRVMAGALLAGVGCSTTTAVQAGSGCRGGSSSGTGGSSSSSGGSTVATGSGGALGSGGATVSGSGGAATSSGGANVDGGGGGGSGGGGAAGTAGTSAGTSAGGSTAAGGDAGTGSGAGGVGAPSDSVIETVQVPASGAAISSKTLLDAGELFLLEATGTVDLGTSLADAEFGGFMTGGTGQDLVAGTDVGVDVGIKVERVPNGATAGRKKWFGAFRADHTYYMTVTGAGTALTMKLLSSTAGPAAGTTGAIAVSIRRLSPVPVVTAVLETLEVPVIKQTVRTTMAPAPGTVYLLQIAGSGKTGGNNLGMGDADWMDWNADGVGKEDIGDNNVDYGVGVDEADTTVSPRLRWWGPWRKDHTYYMLYAGTGSPIGFTYYDSGYGDNSATDQLTLHVFAVPR